MSRRGSLMSVRSGVSGAGPASRRSSFAESRRRMSGVAVGVAVRSSQTAEGVEYAEKDMQVPTFSVGNVGQSTTRRRSSVQSVDSTDSMSQILSNPALWKEFQQRMKDSKCLTGSTANTKEVLRQFIEEKGLDEEELKEDEGQSGFRPNNIFQKLGGSSNNDSAHSFGSMSCDSIGDGDCAAQSTQPDNTQAPVPGLRKGLMSARMIAQASSSRRESFSAAAPDRQVQRRRSSSARRSMPNGRLSLGDLRGNADESQQHPSWFRSSIVSLGSGSQAKATDHSASQHSRRRDYLDDASLPASLVTAMRFQDARAAEREQNESEKNDHYNSGFSKDFQGGYTMPLGESLPRRPIGLAHSRTANNRTVTPTGGAGRDQLSSRRRPQRSSSFHSCGSIDSIDELSIESDVSDDSECVGREDKVVVSTQQVDEKHNNSPNVMLREWSHDEDAAANMPLQYARRRSLTN